MEYLSFVRIKTGDKFINNMNSEELHKCMACKNIFQIGNKCSTYEGVLILESE